MPKSVDDFVAISQKVLIVSVASAIRLSEYKSALNFLEPTWICLSILFTWVGYLGCYSNRRVLNANRRHRCAAYAAVHLHRCSDSDRCPLVCKTVIRLC